MYPDDDFQEARPEGRPGEWDTSSSLLPGLRQRLRLDQGGEAAPQVAEFKHSAWYVRAAAVRGLGVRAPYELLLAALDDPHVSVRANAVQALSELGESAPLERLTQALLGDSEWQVRESAALALGTLGTRAPGTPLLAALHDPDVMVRRAAYQALEQTHPELLVTNTPVTLPEQENQARYTAVTKSWHVLQPMFKHRYTVHSSMNEEEKYMHETDFSTEITAATNGKTNLPEPSRQPKRRLWRVVGLSVAVVIVIINLLAWSLLTHMRHLGTQTASRPGSQANSPAATTSSITGPLGKTLFTYPARGTTIDDLMSVGWSPDGKYVSVSALDVKLLNASSGHVVKTFDQMSASVWASWSPDGTRLAASSGNVQIWDVRSGKVLVTYTPKSALASSFVPHGNPMASLSGGNMVYDSEWSPDGKYIASAVNGNIYGFNVQIWDATTGAPVRTLQVKSNATVDDYIAQVAWSPDGKYIAANSPNNGVFVWNAATGQHVYTRQEGTSAMAWASQGNLIASSDNTGRVRVWEATSGVVQFSFQGQTSASGVSALAWSPDGKYIAASGHDVRVWDVAANKLHYTYTGHGSDSGLYINRLAWSPDSKALASMATGMHVTAPHTGISLDAVNVWIAA